MAIRGCAIAVSLSQLRVTAGHDGEGWRKKEEGACVCVCVLRLHAYPTSSKRASLPPLHLPDENIEEVTDFV